MPSGPGWPRLWLPINNVVALFIAMSSRRRRPACQLTIVRQLATIQAALSVLRCCIDRRRLIRLTWKSCTRPLGETLNRHVAYGFVKVSVAGSRECARQRVSMLGRSVFGVPRRRQTTLALSSVSAWNARLIADDRQVGKSFRRTTAAPYRTGIL